MKKALDDARSTPVYVKKRAVLTLLSFFKRNRSIYDYEKWHQGFIQLMNSQNYGLLLSTCALINGTISVIGRQGYEDLVPKFIKILANINQYATDYFYYMTPCPWL